MTDESVTILSEYSHSNESEDLLPLPVTSMHATIFPQQQTMSLVHEFFRRQKTEVGSLYKTRLCVYAMSNAVHLCPFGSGCKFAHSLSEMRSRPDLTKTALCKHVKFDNRATSTCSRGNCKYAHSLAELRVDPRYMEAFKLFETTNPNFVKLGASPPHLHTVKRISNDTIVTSCEFCGKFCRITPRLPRCETSVHAPCAPTTQFFHGQPLNS